MFGMDLKRTVFMFSAVHEWTAEKIVSSLVEMDKTEGDLNIIINSPGGVVKDMFAIIDAVAMLKNKVNTMVLGTDASAATGISIVTSGRRLMGKNAEMMIHGLSYFSYGTTGEGQKKLDDALKAQDLYFKLVAEKSNVSVEMLKSKTEDGDWTLTAEEALSHGFIDAVLSQEEYSKLKLSESITSKAKPLTDTEHKEIHLLQAGKHHTENYGEINIETKDLELMVENFHNNIVGRDISIDYTHENDNGEKKAGAWVKDLKIKNNGLYALVEYTPAALKMVKDKEYKYASSEFVTLNYVNHEEKTFDMVLTGGTLTNRPAIKNLKKLSEKNKEKVMELKDFKNVDILAHLKTATGIDYAEMAAKNQTLNTELTAANEKATTLQATADKAAKEVVDTGKETAFDTILKAGKVVPVQKEQIMAKFKDAKEIEEFYKSQPAGVNMEAIGDGSADVNEASMKIRAERISEETGKPVEGILASMKKINQQKK